MSSRSMLRRMAASIGESEHPAGVLVQVQSERAISMGRHARTHDPQSRLQFRLHSRSSPVPGGAGLIT